MRQFITAVVLTVATMTGIQAKPPSDGQGGQGGFKQPDFKKADFKKDNFKKDNLKKDNFKKDNFKKDNFKKDNFKKDNFKKAQSGHNKHYLKQHGKKFSHGYCYSGKQHSHWTYRCFWPKYGCNCYYCPSACCWYYWCEPRLSYMPVSYIQSAPPVVEGVVPAPPMVVPDETEDELPSGPGGAGPVEAIKASPMK